jgi:hypothetical protein
MGQGRQIGTVCAQPSEARRVQLVADSGRTQLENVLFAITNVNCWSTRDGSPFHVQLSQRLLNSSVDVMVQKHHHKALTAAS